MTDKPSPSKAARTMHGANIFDLWKQAGGTLDGWKQRVAPILRKAGPGPLYLVTQQNLDDLLALVDPQPADAADVTQRLALCDKARCPHRAPRSDFRWLPGVGRLCRPHFDADRAGLIMFARQMHTADRPYIQTLPTWETAERSK